MRQIALTAAIAALSFGALAQAAVIDDFNTSLGHFTSNVYNASGADSNLASTSTSARVTTDSVEGSGSDKITLDPTSSSASSRLRHLSGGGTPANNVNFATSAGTDGWIGFYLKTDVSGWNVQLYIEPGSSSPATGSNGGIPKSVIGDNQWHLYEWNLDDNTGDANGWGTITSIATGVATVGNGNHTVDSIVFRTDAASTPAPSTFYLDFLAVNPTGHVSALLPEPASLSLLALGAAPLIRRRRR